MKRPGAILAFLLFKMRVWCGPGRLPALFANGLLSVIDADAVPAPATLVLTLAGLFGLVLTLGRRSG